MAVIWFPMTRLDQARRTKIVLGVCENLGCLFYVAMRAKRHGVLVSPPSDV